MQPFLKDHGVVWRKMSRWRRKPLIPNAPTNGSRINGTHGCSNVDDESCYVPTIYDVNGTIIIEINGSTRFPR